MFIVRQWIENCKCWDADIALSGEDNLEQVPHSHLGKTTVMSDPNAPLSPCVGRHSYLNEREHRQIIEIRQVKKPVEKAPEPDLRNPFCVENWPECERGEYNPACCRFPKSCSC